MKQIRSFALLALPAALYAAGAHAQSSVTLYGIADAGIAYVHNAQNANGSNASSLVKFSSGNLSGSRWGCAAPRISAAGLPRCSSSRTASTSARARSASSREFGRKAVVGLASSTYGTVTLGRQYDPVVDLVQGLTQDNYFGGVFATPGDLDNYDNSLRVSNSVKYTAR